MGDCRSTTELGEAKYLEVHNDCTRDLNEKFHMLALVSWKKTRNTVNSILRDYLTCELRGSRDACKIHTKRARRACW